MAMAVDTDSACSNRLPGLKFVGDTLSISSLSACQGLVTLILVRIIARGVDKLPTDFGVSRLFRSRLIGNTC